MLKKTTQHSLCTRVEKHNCFSFAFSFSASFCLFSLLSANRVYTKEHFLIPMHIYTMCIVYQAQPNAGRAEKELEKRAERENARIRIFDDWKKWTIFVALACTHTHTYIQSANIILIIVLRKQNWIEWTKKRSHKAYYMHIMERKSDQRGMERAWAREPSCTAHAAQTLTLWVKTQSEPRDRAKNEAINI